MNPPFDDRDPQGAQARLVELDELVRRVEALEERTATEKP